MSSFEDMDDMCPNCLTPWKCNGPHLIGETPTFQREMGDKQETGRDRLKMMLDQAMQARPLFLSPPFSAVCADAVLEYLMSLKVGDMVVINRAGLPPFRAKIVRFHDRQVVVEPRDPGGSRLWVMRDECTVILEVTGEPLVSPVTDRQAPAE